MVEDALSATEQAPAAPVGSNEVLFSFGDTRLLSKLDEILSDMLDPEQIAMVMDRLRAELYAGLSSTSIASLHTLIINYKTSNGDKPQLPHWNTASPDVVFVSDTPPRWGDTDAQFVEELKRVGFKSASCAWTSIVRYNPEDVSSLGSEEVGRWREFLFSELRIWKPKLIVALGAYATNTLLGEGPKLAERQNIVHWLGPWAILPMYSYAYASNSNRLDAFRQGLDLGYKFCFGNL